MINYLDSLSDQLLEQKWAIIDNFANQDLQNALLLLFAEIDFKKAGISKNALQVSEIRGDHISWIDDHTTFPAEISLMKKIEDLMLFLNKVGYLGLKTKEMHYAQYPIGAFYKRHLDVFKNNSNRAITLILYLNQNWKKEDEGQLVIYGVVETKIEPIAGRLVCFFSDQLEHEVKPTQTIRRSITGWLKR